jgi:hypothetical protein
MTPEREAQSPTDIRNRLRDLSSNPQGICALLPSNYAGKIPAGALAEFNDERVQLAAVLSPEQITAVVKCREQSALMLELLC